MGKNQDHIIARHTLEVRLKNRSLSFMDFKGEMGDFVLKKMAWNQLKVTGVRLDITNENFSEILFFSWENFGIQIEAQEDFDGFKTKIKKLFEILNEFKKYQCVDIARLGTKSSIYYHKNGMSFDGLKEIYKNIMFKDVSILEKDMGAKITDTGIIAVDMKSDDEDINFTTGPMEKEEIITKIFQNKLYDGFQYGNGIYFDIDVFKKDLGALTLKELEERALKNIESIEAKLAGFLSYFSGVNKK